MSKLSIRIGIIASSWIAGGFLVARDLTLFQKFTIVWGMVVLTFATLVLTHFHFKNWGPEIKHELEKLGLKWIRERPLTLFEMVQFADTRFFIEIFSFNFKRIVEVEHDNLTKELCIRIRKNFLSNTIEAVEVIGKV